MSKLILPRWKYLHSIRHRLWRIPWLAQVSNNSLRRQLTPSMPSAALASSDDVSRKYSKMPFLRRQNDGINAKSIGDEMPSAVCAAEGAMIRPLLSLPRLSRSVEARIQPGLSSARMLHQMVVAPLFQREFTERKKKRPAPPCLVNRSPFSVWARSHRHSAGQPPLRPAST